MARNKRESAGSSSKLPAWWLLLISLAVYAWTNISTVPDIPPGEPSNLVRRSNDHATCISGARSHVTLTCIARGFCFRK